MELPKKFEELIEISGGSFTTLAYKIGVNENAVRWWAVRGIPHRYHADIKHILKVSYDFIGKVNEEILNKC